MKKILVIEDEHPLREAICEILKFENFKVLQAKNGLQGVELALHHAPDLILCDVMMPVKGGMEVLLAIRSNETTRHTPFIFITALSGRSDIRAGMEQGADDYITKPFTRDELLKAVSVRMVKSAEIRETLKHTAEVESINKSLNAFAHNISHDLKAPIRVMDGYSKMLLEDYNGILDQEGISYLETIRTNSSKMSLLIDGLLLFSRQRGAEVNRTIVNMKKLVQSVVDDSLDGKEQKPVTIIIGEIPDATCDATMITQVFINLISNAIKYSAKKDNPRIEIGHTSIEQEGVYFIRDNGVGFDMKDYPKLFGVFHRLHSELEFTGIGIGLSIVKEIIEKHGGRVWAEGVLDEGTALFFTLPS